MSTFLDNLAENLRYARSRIAETVGPVVERVVRNWRENRERYQARAAAPRPLERRPGKIRYPGTRSPDGRWIWNGADWVPTPLRDQISLWQSRGYFVTSQTETSASMVKPKRFSFWWALFWFLWCGVGVVVYVFYYASRHDSHIYLTAPPPAPSSPPAPTV